MSDSTSGIVSDLPPSKFTIMAICRPFHVSPTSIVVAVSLVASLLTGCTLPRMSSPNDHGEDFSPADTYAHSFPATSPATCEAARRALLSQGYIVDDAKPSLVKGNKNFQRGGDTHVQIAFSVVCAADRKGSGSIAFANAVRDTYSLKKSSTSASVGVGVLGSLSVPFGASDDSLVRVGSETIQKKKFYDQFFELLEGYLEPISTPIEEKVKIQEPVAPGL
jgi:hypothetical protein